VDDEQLLIMTKPVTHKDLLQVVEVLRKVSDHLKLVEGRSIQRILELEERVKQLELAAGAKSAPDAGDRWLKVV
jgi:hypothetical protein